MCCNPLGLLSDNGVVHVGWVVLEIFVVFPDTEVCFTVQQCTCPSIAILNAHLAHANIDSISVAFLNLTFVLAVQILSVPSIKPFFERSLYLDHLLDSISGIFQPLILLQCLERTRQSVLMHLWPVTSAQNANQFPHLTFDL